MNVTTDHLFGKIGALTVENDLLRAEVARLEKLNAEHCATIAGILGERKEREIAAGRQNGTPLTGVPVQD